MLPPARRLSSATTTAVLLALAAAHLGVGRRIQHGLQQSIRNATGEIAQDGPAVVEANQSDRSQMAYEDNISAGVPYQGGVKSYFYGDISDPNKVDFAFMTDDLEYVGKPNPKLGFLAKFRRVRPKTSDKEELVRGHFCAKRGTRPQSYFASSLCYWLPEISNGEPHQGLGFLWRGGVKAPGDVQLCGNLGALGRCVKCSVCHDNAENKERKVGWTAFEEELALPPGCIKEREIESNLTVEFDGENAALAEENHRCAEVLGRYDAAVAAYDRNQQRIQALTHRIEVEIPDQIRGTQMSINELLGQWNSLKDSEMRTRDHTRRDCYDWRNLRGYHSTRWWDDLNNHNVDTQSILYAMPNFHCRRPRRPFDDASPYEWQQYNNELREYGACDDCDDAKSELQRAFNRRKKVEQKIQAAEQHLQSLQGQLAQAHQALQDEQGRSPALLDTKQAMETEWHPQKGSCEGTFGEYKALLAQKMVAGAPAFYDQSCEKACLELQKSEDQGCGVMEGGKPDDVVHNGGITPTCRPPFPSWVKAPFHYANEAEQEPEEQQCGRIFASQTPTFAQSVIKTGVLWKKGRWFNKWNRRYFVLESGDQVRAAVLRYFDTEPSQADAKESYDKKIFLWDARRIQKRGKAGKNGSVCFEIVHFYRTYTLCVPPDEAAGGDARADRDDWVNLIMTGMGFPSR